MNSNKKEFRAKQEAGGTKDDGQFSKSIPSSSRQWAGFKNPRIVRVSRAFGGKDRHSKVCTVRGLRDRRIRLSVPTAIQLYDLQDRLGLSQPSKVVDWLLDATKHDIDKLPPLQLPPGSFSRSHQPPHIFQDSANTEASLSHYFNANPPYMKDGAIQGFLSSKEGLKIGDNFDAALRGKSKGNDSDTASGKDKWIASNEQENQEGIGIGGYVPQVSAQNFFPFGNQSYLPGMSNNPMAFNWEPSNLSLAQFGNNSFSTDSQNHPPVSFPSSMPCPSGSQLYLYPTATALPSIIPPYMTTSIDTDPRQQLNHFHLLSSNSQHALPNQLVPTLHLISSPMKSFSLNDDPQGFHSHEDDNSQPHKGGSSS